MMMYLLACYMMFLSGMIVYIHKCNHLLIMLLSLEFISVSIYMILFKVMSFSGNYYFSLVYLTMVVCESALGLSLLVSMIRTHGNDYILTFSSLW
uniref:NADH-ubiquinone oxidoreductase chain 4L n=1 Tax=Brachycerus muricatus TaxID=159793 RepID=J9PJ47_9CUCU|nr:NADH dehydrogenase subunit 4L [Brachycerus muricatus]